jgi:hypothetical protein
MPQHRASSPAAVNWLYTSHINSQDLFGYIPVPKVSLPTYTRLSPQAPVQKDHLQSYKQGIIFQAQLGKCQSAKDASKSQTQ